MSAQPPRLTAREQYLAMALSLGNCYSDKPFHDDNWVLVRHCGTKKTFAFTFERDGVLRVNLKLPPDWREFFRSVYAGVTPGYHMNKEHWSTVVLDGSIPDGEIVRMTQMSFDMTAPHARRTR